MNTIVEFTLVTIGILMLLLVPVALIAGGLASRSVAKSAHLDRNQDEAEEPSQVVVPISKRESPQPLSPTENII
jgi:hypothetical protein